MKPKQCKSCKLLFTPVKALQHVCSPKCAIALVTVKREARESKLARLAHRQAKERLKTRSQHLREAQTAFNQFIRRRDAHCACISCGNYLSNQYCAGHYRTVGSAPHLRFDERNVHKQCNRYCNMELSGNLIAYRHGLIAKIGMAEVERLEADQTPKKYTIDEIKAIKQTYKEKLNLSNVKK